MNTDIKNYLKKFSENLFSELKNHEDVSLNLHSEESDFIRFNNSKVRQNTSVNQHEVNFVYQADQRQYKSAVSLTLDLEHDTQFIKTKLDEVRRELPKTDVNPKFTPIENNGTSEVYQKTERPQSKDLIQVINSTFSDTDLAGFWCSGPLRQASVNSKGQFHFFENDSFFFDYSLYNGPRAAKGFFSEPDWNEKSFIAQAQQTKNTLSLLSKPLVKVKPGAYRSYLAPMAVAELMGMFYWRALSRSMYEQGYAPLKKLNLKEKLFSPQFNLIENNLLGLDSHFNSLGEKVPDQIPIIENGELKNFLISTATAKEYNLVSNQAEPSEMLRSPEVRAGTLDEKDILKTLDQGLFLSNLHYINWSDAQAARVTGMTRFACFWVEKGEIVGPIQDLRFDDTLYNIWGDQLIGLTKTQQIFTSTSTYNRREKGGMKVPGAILRAFNFTL
jgi:predicted Zn-dependent protease